MSQKRLLLCEQKTGATMSKMITKNVEMCMNVTKELYQYTRAMHKANAEEKRMYARLIDSLTKQLRLLNDSLFESITSVSLIQKLPEHKEPIAVPITMHQEVSLMLDKHGKDEFLKELNISASLIKKIKTRQSITPKQLSEYQTASYYSKLSNKLFFPISQKLVNQGSFKSMLMNVRKSNLSILSTTYVSMVFFTMLLGFIVGLFMTLFLTFFTIDIGTLSVMLVTSSRILRFATYFWLPLALPLILGGLLYVYPNTEKNATGKRIDQELPFVVIHMGSISGSGIDPLEIFRIIALSKEYEFAGQEIKKIINQTNLYGYDLSTALRNVSLSTPSVKLSELLNGMSVAINSGGDMKKFFEKRAESLLLDYRLEREKSTKSAETFMDLYISIVIATPMIMMMLLIIISVSGIQTPLSGPALPFLIIGVVVVANVLFLTFLHIKQPTN